MPDTSTEAVERLASDCAAAIVALQAEFPTGRAILKECRDALRALASERDALRAEVERLREGPKVKPLEWEGAYVLGVCGWRSGDYEVFSGRWRYRSGPSKAASGSDRAAKAAAQSHYEARILAALEQKETGHE